MFFLSFTIIFGGDGEELDQSIEFLINFMFSGQLQKSNVKIAVYFSKLSHDLHI